MDYYRNTPVEKKQMVRTYERFSQVVSHLLQPNGRMLVVSEWGGRSVKASSAFLFCSWGAAFLAAVHVRLVHVCVHVSVYACVCVLVPVSSQVLTLEHNNKMRTFSF